MNIDNVVFVDLLYFQTFCVTYSGILGYRNVSDVKIRYHCSMEALILFVPLLTDTKTTVGRQPMHLRGWPCVMGDNFICSVFSNIWSSVRLKIPLNGQLKKLLLFLLPFHSCAPCRAHQTRWSGRYSSPISAEVTFPRLQSEIKVALFLFASHSFLENSLRFMVKLIVKTCVINGKIHKNKRKRFYSSNKEGLICWYKTSKELERQTSANLYWRNSRWIINPKS